MTKKKVQDRRTGFLRDIKKGDQILIDTRHGLVKSVVTKITPSGRMDAGCVSFSPSGYSDSQWVPDHIVESNQVNLNLYKRQRMISYIKSNVIANILDRIPTEELIPIGNVIKKYKISDGDGHD